MVLTGKALEDFLLYKGCLKEELNDEIYYPKDTWLYAEIIEWFDSVGIYIDIVIVFKKDTPKYVYYYGRYANQSQQYNTRQEATKQAIIKANEIYNEQQQEK